MHNIGEFERPRVNEVTVLGAAEGGPDNGLRRFVADIRMDISDLGEDLEKVGEISGWVCWQPFDYDLAVCGDDYDDDAVSMGRAAQQMIRQHCGFDVDGVILVRLATLQERWRGNRVLHWIVDDVMGAFVFRPERTVVVMIPEPMTPNGPMKEGPERDAAMAKLTRAYSEQGFEPWADSRVWWKPVSTDIH